jgi:galactokinase
MRVPAIALFHSSFTVAPRVGASAPGRVNLIGEHTDYNGGPVLPMAVARRTTAVAGPADAGVLELVSATDGIRSRLLYKEEAGTGWSRYLVGVARELAARGVVPPDFGARVAVASDVPVGAGLASSAALTVAGTRALAALVDATLTPRTVADVAFHAEYDHVGVRCGRMDQTIAVLGRRAHALLFDCATLETTQIPFAGRLLLVDTRVRHELAASAFNQRRAQCEAALERLRTVRPGMQWLAEWPATALARLRRELPEPLRRRALHVVGETARTRLAARALSARRLRAVGRLMFRSHESCRRLYECSAPELDLVVRTARRAGAWGARMTGAGWGGAALVLVDPTRQADIAESIRRAFVRAFHTEPVITEIASGPGARRERI